MEEIFSNYWFALEDDELIKFKTLLDLFIKRNSEVNLSAIRDESWIIHKHFVDSVYLNAFLELHWKVLDIWTWWWFPWIPLAITNPHVDFVLMDSTRKKIDSVNFFANQLWLDNVEGIWWRAEELSTDKSLYWSFDFVVSRATAYLPVILSYAIPYLKPRWKIFIYKLFDEKEIEDWKKYLSWKRQMKFHNYKILDQDRIIIEI